MQNIESDGPVCMFLESVNICSSSITSMQCSCQLNVADVRALYINFTTVEQFELIAWCTDKFVSVCGGRGRGGGGRGAIKNFTDVANSF